jgi:CRP-like cAMP-binding protein
VKDAGLSADELAALRQALRKVAPLSDADLESLTTPSRRVVLPRGTSLLKAGEHADTTVFVLSGGLREYYVLEDGTERTKGFNLPGEFGGSLSDLLSERPSRVWITVEASAVLVCTPWQVYHRLSMTSTAWSHFARRFAEALYLVKVEREFELLALSASQRYARVLQRWPTLEAVFSQKDIASYVGVTPVHLSRLRRAVSSPALASGTAPEVGPTTGVGDVPGKPSAAPRKASKKG